jgi:ArsR family transcriptional regulator, arsenate/arsenite/antimonite-responsive transcriptional repressor
MAATELNVLDPSVVQCCAPLGTPNLEATEAAATAGLFKALADPHRVRIMNLLVNSDRAVCVCELVEPLGLTQPTVSFHLKKLREAGLVTRYKQGTWSYYEIDGEALQRLGRVFGGGE